jgi:Ca-activated chloride channel family protein
MNTIHFNNLAALFFLWLLPAVAALFIYASRKRNEALQRFADQGVLGKINTGVDGSMRIVKLALVLAGFALIVFGLARPGWNPKAKTVERSGRDVAFIIDVSKSMLANDLAPDRLTRAKLSIIDCVDALEGDRVALIAFAGTAALKCPLTLDYGFFRAMVEDISVDSIERGGTRIGDAIRKALGEVFDSNEKRFKDIILITDGEDHDSFPLDAAKEAGDKGVRLIAFGLGDENTGMRIPVTDATGQQTFMKYTDNSGNTTEVWSKLDADTLRKMALATPDGKYLNVATGNFDLGKIYTELVASAEKRELSAESVMIYDEQYQWLLGAGFVLLAIEPLVGIRRRRVENNENA